VILWPDIAGLRPSKMAMGRRLAAEGFAVLVANPFYRSVAGVQFEDFAAFRDGGGFQAVGPWREKNTPAAIMETAKSVVGWLDAQAAVDTARGIGNQGYCMTGSWTFYTAAAVPSRVKAAASFHGGGLAGDAADSAMNLFDDMADGAKALIAIAKNDDANAPADKDKLRAAAAAADLDLEIEVYDGDHGWTVLDSPAYAEAAAERAFGRLLALYRSAL
jgi:carboxymethylenebutenolidase